MARLGPERVEVLRGESHQRAKQGLERQAEQVRDRLKRLRLTAQWQARPHSRLTDAELARAIRDAERRQADHHDAADRARRQLAEQEPAVAAGHGPRVSQLDAELHRLRVNAERQATVEEIERRWHQLKTKAGDAAERAARKEFDADRTRRWQPGRRDQLLAEAAADKAHAQQRNAQAAELARHAAELQRQLGGPDGWRLAREQAERAEASYPHDRERAMQRDRDDLARLRDRIATQETAATDARQRRDQLLAEQQLRTSMPQHQATLEQQLRTQAVEQHQRE
jgi:hypothetical protein